MLVPLSALAACVLSSCFVVTVPRAGVIGEGVGQKGKAKERRVQAARIPSQRFIHNNTVVVRRGTEESAVTTAFLGVLVYHLQGKDRSAGRVGHLHREASASIGGGGGGGTTRRNAPGLGSEESFPLWTRTRRGPRTTCGNSAVTTLQSAAIAPPQKSAGPGHTVPRPSSFLS